MNSSSISIVHVAPYYPPHVGGLERVAERLANIFARADYSVTVLASDIGGTSGTVREGALTVKRLWSFEFAHTPFAPTLLWNLFAVPKKSILHVHLSQAYWPELVLLVSKLRGIPYLVHFHLDVEPSGRLGFLFRLYKKILWGPFLRNGAGVIAFSQEQASLLRHKYGVDLNKVHIIPNAISEEFFLSREYVPSNNRLELLYVGRLARQKRVDRLIEAVALLRVPAHLTVVGDGDARADLETMVKSAGVRGVSFVGYKSPEEVRAFCERSHMLLISSDREGMPLSVLEAMAAGLPIVGSNVMGIRELVEGAGVLVDEPYPQSFATAVEALQKNPSQMTEFSRLSRSRAGEYTWPNLVKKLDALYKTIFI
jgi:glycosyltransferase involved in cell wall biosynthesis